MSRPLQNLTSHKCVVLVARYQVGNVQVVDTSYVDGARAANCSVQESEIYIEKNNATDATSHPDASECSAVSGVDCIGRRAAHGVCVPLCRRDSFA